jgi:hypothetical protein
MHKVLHFFRERREWDILAEGAELLVDVKRGADGNCNRGNDRLLFVEVHGGDGRGRAEQQRFRDEAGATVHAHTVGVVHRQKVYLARACDVRQAHARRADRKVCHGIFPGVEPGDAAFGLCRFGCHGGADTDAAWRLGRGQP